MRRLAIPLLSILLALFVLFFPIFSSKTYFVYIGTLTGIYIILALSYDLVVGRIGALSFAHPAFFGIGAYAAAILSTRYDTSLLPNIVAACFVAGVFATFIGIPSFRLSSYSFAMGTLGMALVAQLVATNWESLTRGPLCISQVPDARIDIFGRTLWESTGLVTDYYLIAVAAVIIAVIVHRIAISRMGRAFLAIREDELLASARAIDPLRYKISGFVLSAMMASFAGVLFAHFIGVVCPSQLSLDITMTLLVIEFLGGRGSMAGVIVGSVLFTALPEYLRMAATARPLVYGLILFAVIVYFPRGLSGLIANIAALIRGKNAREELGIDSHDELS